MFYLARVLETPNAWADLAELSPAPAHAGGLPAVPPNCPFPVLIDVGYAKSAGASYWRLDPADEGNVRRVIAAYCSMQKNLSALKVKYISTDVLDSIGVGYEQKLVSCPDVNAGKEFHYDLHFADLKQALAAARALTPTMIDFGIEKIAAGLIEACVLGRMSWAKVTPEAVRRLVAEGFLVPRGTN